MCQAFVAFGLLLVGGIIYCLNRLIRRKRLPSVNKAVLITGCDRGFGHTLATKLSLEGYTVYASCLDVDGEGAQSLKKLSNVNVLQLDVTSDTSVEITAVRLNQDLRDTGLWAVVNNAGVAVFAESEWCSMEAYEKVLEVNLMGMIRVTKACLPLVRKAKGRVVNMSSLAGRVALPGFTAYSASKFAVIGYSDSLKKRTAQIWSPSYNY